MVISIIIKAILLICGIVVLLSITIPMLMRWHDRRYIPFKWDYINNNFDIPYLNEALGAKFRLIRFPHGRYNPHLIDIVYMDGKKETAWLREIGSVETLIGDVNHNVFEIMTYNLIGRNKQINPQTIKFWRFNKSDTCKTWSDFVKTACI